MVFNVKKAALITAIILIVVLIAMTIYAKSKKRKEFDNLLGEINKEPKGCTEIDKLSNVSIDKHFNATHYASVLYNAKGSCWVCDDDEEDVWMVLSNKTLPEIKAIEAAMENRYGYSILGYLKTFFNEEELARAKKIIDNAPD